ncbi:Uma2 family endonuclease [Roseisolibacter sp. H3M3-2]|uniref:Uma2 family endonuclease n=1 Tax=Roseisolibacter sp. H3M3-2 TaxID=3031323 RepID=UPI0023DA8394|nr:Uma2 family endonuclease [Roseisolibacter sp. H3M3-2]MDF1505299.1 Uma2 family endonuclease [Roseisolibacter sp. H3M3-2]
MATIALPLPRYTVADLEQFPDDGNRYELLEGWLLVTAMPGSAHQWVVTQVASAFHVYLGRGRLGFAYGGGGAQHGVATLLIPDVLVTGPDVRPGRPWSEMTERWLAVEVLSPSTRMYDRDYKVRAYLGMGVREVWLVDPWARAVEVHRAIGEAPDVVRETLAWRAPGADAPLTVAVAALFDGAGAGD